MIDLIQDAFRFLFAGLWILGIVACAVILYGLAKYAWGYITGKYR